MKFEDIEPYIVCKAAPLPAELNGRVSIGFKNVEIHLEEWHVRDNIVSAVARRNILQSGLNVVGVHAPLKHDELVNTLIPEVCINSDIRGEVSRTLSLAQDLADVMKHKVYVVLHSLSSVELLKQEGQVWDSISNFFLKSIHEYPDVVYTFENITPICELGAFVSGSCFENVSICKALREEIGQSYFFTTLDTCHALTTTRMYNLLNEYDNNIICPKFDTFADINRKYVNNIHLSYVEQLGFAPGTHGISHDLANRESYDHFNECMEYITSLSDNMPHITLEVKEQDYSNPQSSIIQRQNIAEYFNKE